MARVIGLGGVFIKFNDPSNMRAWYKEALGIVTNDYGILYKFNHTATPGYLQVGTFESTTDYFRKENQQVMLNFRVDNLLEIIEQLKKKNVAILNEVESYEYGKFLHIQDPEGNTIELWEPVDGVFDAENSDEMN